jgi:putative ABC transport system permease protein
MRPSALGHIRIGPLAAYATAKANWDYVQESGADPTNPKTTDPTSGEQKKNKLNDVQRRQYYETFVQAEAAMHSAGQDLTAAQVAYDQARQQEAAEVPLGVAQQKLFGARAVDSAGLRVSNISIQVADAAQIRAVSEQIAAILRERHRLKPDGSQDDFGVFNQADTLASLNQITTVLTAFLGAIAGISLLVGGIGVMNIMLVSVTERTREIGLRKAVGARRRDILTQFLIESVVVSLLGGLIGLLLGSGIAVAVGLSGLITPIVSPSALLLAIGFAAAVGVFFGSYPAQRAARLRPIEALRYE